MDGHDSMCGIFGYVKEDAFNGTLKCMGYAMKFRGPDAKGYHKYNDVNMGYVRLSIIDVKHGNQPFISASGHIVVFQNGEIYNFKELQSQLAALGRICTTQCDTEVLLQGYLAWGWSGLLEKIDGMFAISILDKEKNKLFIARDRFGEKPLYYFNDPDSFVYSSNLKAMKECDWLKFELCPISMQYYLFLHYIPWENTIFKNIHKLLPGYYLEYDLATKTLTNKQYYSLPCVDPIVPDVDYLDNLFAEEFLKRNYADVPVGVFLSGGLDSSLLTYYLRKHNQSVATFSIGFDDSQLDESRYSDHVAKILSTNHHHYIFTENLFSTLLDELSEQLDEPLGDPALLPTYFLSLQASKHAKVVLSGEGADEIFGGYAYYRQAQMNQSRLLLPNHTTPSGFPLVAAKSNVHGIINNLSEDLILNEEKFIQQYRKYTCPLDAALYTDMTTWLPDNLLVKLDRATMAASIEGRAPYLSRKIVEYGLSIKDTYKIDGVRNKKILQDIAQRYLPENIVHRPKQGFVLPMKSWLSNYLQKINIVEYLFELDVPGLNVEALGMLLVESKLHGVVNTRFTFSLIMLLKWYEKFMSK